MNEQEKRLQDAAKKTNAALGEIKTGVDSIKTQNTSVLEQLAELKSNNPDLEDEVTAIEDAANQTQAIADSLKVPETPGAETTGGTDASPALPGDGGEVSNEPSDTGSGSGSGGASPGDTEGEG